jgi:predicted TIM-barrel fold metal-dependent hydrolase
MTYKYYRLLVIIAILQNCGQPQNPAQTGYISQEPFYTMKDFKTVAKIDAHVHVNTNAPDFVQQAQDDSFRLLTINLDDKNEPPPMEIQQQYALQQVKSFPGQISYATSFSIRQFNDTGWLQQQEAYLKNSFDHGAIAVKIYKVIGMQLRDKAGKMVMIDDPRFDPLLDFIEKNNITVIGHLGEPRNCWLPVDQMTVKGDKNYFSQNPEYHMYLHPEYPSYEAQVAARDNMVRKHPNLRFVGAHLGSLEWNVDSLAQRLDEFPNMAVDMAARICHLEYQTAQNWQHVRDFVIKYQDQLLYATDLGAEVTTNADEIKARAHATHLSDWEYFATSDTMSVKDFDGSFKGLHLPKEVMDKIYRTNAEKWFPGLFGGKKQ